MFESPPAIGSFDADTLERVPKPEQAVEERLRGGTSGPTRDRSRPRNAAQRNLEVSLTIAYDLWLGSWETALAALATASHSRTLSTIEAAAHKTVIAAERELVTKQFTRLLGHEVTRRRVSEDVAINGRGVVHAR